MFGQPQSNYGFSQNTFNQAPQNNQMGYQHSSFMGQTPLNVQNQNTGYMQSNNMQNHNAMEDYYSQKQMNNTSNMQNQFMMGQQNNTMQQDTMMQNQHNQFNMGFNNQVPQMNNMNAIPQNNMMQQADVQMTSQMNQADPAQGAAVYTPYENLPNYPDNVDLNQVVEQMKVLFEDKTHWKPKFDAIDNLRILNKYHSKKMNEIVIMFWNYIHESFESQKTFIAKNILMFSTEVFMNAAEVRLQDDVVMAIIPQVINKSTSEKSVLKKEAESALIYLINNCCYDSSVITLSKCCFEKNPAVCEIALLSLGKMVCNIGDRLPMLRFESLQTLMLALGKIIDAAKKGNMKKWATALCENMYQRFGRENYQELVMQTVGNTQPDLVQYFVKAIENKKENKPRESGFHEYVKEQKKIARMTNYGMMNNMQQQKMNPQTLLGQPMLEKQLQSEQYQYNNNQMGMQQQYNGMGGLFGGQVGFNFPQNY